MPLRLDDFFTDRAIIDVLCRLRASHAKNQHDREFFDRMVVDERQSQRNTDSEIAKLFPPRSLWRRPSRRNRKGGAFETNLLTLRQTVTALRQDARHTSSDWCVRMNSLIDRVRDRALRAAGHYFRVPEIFFIRKKGNVYRPLCVFEVEDRVVDTLVARYLRTALDPTFVPNSFAFRVASPRRPAPRHHDAVRQILLHHQRASRKRKWVAECDICAFFDSVHHDVARDGLERALERLSPVTVDHMALRIFEAYLACYTFTFDVKGRALTAHREKHPRADCKWYESELAGFGRDPFQERIGIPQGGALSCLIANLVLDRADRAVLDGPTDEGLFYARYCDDMVIIHRRRRACERAFSRYLGTLAELRLPVHTPFNVPPYQNLGRGGSKNARLFWTQKSKRPYAWSAEPGGVPHRR